MGFWGKFWNVTKKAIPYAVQSTMMLGIFNNGLNYMVFEGVKNLIEDLGEKKLTNRQRFERAANVLNDPIIRKAWGLTEKKAEMILSLTIPALQESFPKDGPVFEKDEDLQKRIDNLIHS